MPTFQINDGKLTKVGLWTGTVIKFPETHRQPEFRGRRYKVTKLNPKNIKMMDENGKEGYTLNRAYAETIIDENQDWAGPAEKSEYQKQIEIIEAGVVLGTAVKLKRATDIRRFGSDVYVCIAIQSKGTLKLAKLGGDGNRFLHNFQLADVEIVEVPSL